MTAIYVLSKGMQEYPEQVVLRRHVIVNAGAGLVADCRPIAVAKTVQDARRMLPAGVTRFDPWDRDDPVIVEWWA